MVFQKRLYQFARVCWSAVPVDTIAKICCPFAARNLVYILPAVFMSEGHNLHSVQLICWMDDANKTIRYWWANSPYDSVAWQQDTLFLLCLIFSPKKKSFFFFFLCDFISVLEGVLNTKYNVVGPVHWSYCKCDINKIDALTLELGELFPQINSVSQNFMSISRYH